MKYRQSMYLLAGIIFFLAVAVAQPRTGERGGRGERGEAQLKQIKEKVGLTEEQETKIRAIMQKAREEMRAEFDNSDGDREAMRDRMIRRTEKTDTEIMMVLTKEQKKKYEQYKKERQKSMQERMRERQ